LFHVNTIEQWFTKGCPRASGDSRLRLCQSADTHSN